MGALIHIENMKKIYNPGENEVRALDGIDLDIEKGDLVAIVGHSGSGKSTLMNMLGCLDTPTSGKYVLDGQDVASMTDNQLADVRNKEIGFIFQGFRAHLIAPFIGHQIDVIRIVIALLIPLQVQGTTVSCMIEEVDVEVTPEQSDIIYPSVPVGQFNDTFIQEQIQVSIATLKVQHYPVFVAAVV